MPGSVGLQAEVLRRGGSKLSARTHLVDVMRSRGFTSGALND